MLDNPITPQTTSITFGLPTGEWQRRGITQATLMLSGATGENWSGFATIDAKANSVTFAVLNGVSTGTVIHPDAGVDEFELRGYSSPAASVPFPPAERDHASPDYEFSLRGTIPVVSTAGPSALHESLDRGRTGDRVSDYRDYWAVPTDRVQVKRGDTIRVVGPAGFFSGAWDAYLEGEMGQAWDAVALTPRISADLSTLTVTVPPSADFTPFFSSQYRPLMPELDLIKADRSSVVESPVMVTNPKPVTVTRLAGADRYATAVALSKAGFPSSAPTVVVATGANFPDALAAGPVAGFVNGPLLLTAPGALRADVSAEITRLKPSKIIVVGGVNVVSDAVERELRALAPTVVRIAGSNREETAEKLVDSVFASAPHVLMATANNFPDALAGATAADSIIGPLLLVDGNASAIDDATRATLQRLGTTDVTLVGGPAAISPQLEESVRAFARVDRAAGADRYGTAVAVAQSIFPTSYNAFLATGSNFPDALAESSLATTQMGPLFTTPSTCVPAATKAEIQWLGISNVVLIGGPAALGPGVAALRTC
ncbi:cell wall-binding repeat-containing protein [Leifsonia sp. fls2-241-R2A-40a]|uniref:cell wall-binding repeat-containing protein n=1 Tax=Leifsonia sp. fls2-241-R2A-40a TaxID=3040290 RepID=UPI00254C2EEA|nr:cell wall-binding repeat-containing protein [Leifsonia sp. fls2-241-R2A-40a]